MHATSLAQCTLFALGSALLVSAQAPLSATRTVSFAVDAIDADGDGRRGPPMRSARSCGASRITRRPARVRVVLVAIGSARLDAKHAKSHPRRVKLTDL